MELFEEELRKVVCKSSNQNKSKDSTMKVCFVSALTMADFGNPELTLGTDQKSLPPLGS